MSNSTVITRDILESAEELRERIETAIGVKTNIHVTIWYPPIDGLELLPESEWRTIPRRDATGQYTCHGLEGLGAYITVFTSEGRQDGKSQTYLASTVKDSVV